MTNKKTNKYNFKTMLNVILGYLGLGLMLGLAGVG